MRKPFPHLAVWRLAATLLIVIVLGGCSATPASPAASSGATASSPPTSANVEPTPRPSPSAEASPSATAVPAWRAAANMVTPHGYPAVARLSDGRVLVAGGVLNDRIDGIVLASVDVYDPTNDSWSAAAEMSEARSGHTATLLNDGTVLVAGSYVHGGEPRASAERFDPASGSWKATGKMRSGRGGHTATLLNDGTVLIAGGYGKGLDDGLASAELYDARSGSWTDTSSMGTPRQGQTATLLADGRVLVVGGGSEVSFAEGPRYSDTAELYDPRTGRWTATARMSMARAGHEAALLPNGLVLVVGGSIGDEDTARSAELYDPRTETWTPTGSMSSARSGHHMTVLADGRVLVFGGVGLGSEPTLLASAELYDPGSGTWTETASPINATYGQRATLLLDGRVLVVGDYDVESLGSAALYEP